MTGPRLSGGWSVRLSGRAERALRRLEPVARSTVARILDRLEAEGPDPAAGVDPLDPRIHTTREGPIELRVSARPGRVVLVVSVRVADARPQVSVGGRIGAVLAGLASDARVSARSLARAPAFTLAVTTTLAVGLGGSTAILGLVHTVYRAALPFADDASLVRLRSRSDEPGGGRLYNMSPRDFHAARRDARAFEGVVAMGGGSVAIREDEGAERVSSISVSEGWTALLGVRPMMGRAFTAQEEALGSESGVVLISDGVWTRFFGGAPDVVGRTLDTVEGALEVVGVMPPRFAYPYDAGVWRPGRFDPTEWQGHDLNVVARLSPGVDIGVAQQDVDRVYEGLRADSPGTTPDGGMRVTSVRDDFIRDHAEGLQGLAAAVVFLLLLALANVGTLLTIRAVARDRESTLRAVLGASRGRLVRLAAVEAGLLFGAGGMAGLVVAALLRASTGALVPGVMRTQLDMDGMRFDPTVVVGSLLVAALAGVSTGTLSALRATRRDLHGVLRGGGRDGAGRRVGRLQNGLVGGEVALALVLLVGAGSLYRHFASLRTADLGYHTEDVVTLQLAVDADRYAAPGARLALFDAIEERVRALPDVRDAGITSVNPLCCGDWGAPVRADDTPRPPDAPQTLIHHRLSTDGWFRALGIPVVRGRPFGPQDTPDTEPVVIVDEALAALLWPGEDPLGRRVGLDREGSPARTVVGVIPTVHVEGDYDAGWYLPLRQDPTGRSAEIVHLMARVRDAAAVRAVRRAVAEIDPALATFGGTTLRSLHDDAIGQDRVGAVISAAFAGVGVVLACLGLYGLLAYRVTLQRREIGTRLALGARREAVVRLVLGRSLRILAVGVVVGGALAWAVNAALVRTVLGVEMTPPSVVAGLAATLVGASLVSALVPALRAARVDPARTVTEA